MKRLSVRRVKDMKISCDSVSKVEKKSRAVGIDAEFEIADRYLVQCGGCCEKEGEKCLLENGI